MNSSLTQLIPTRFINPNRIKGHWIFKEKAHAASDNIPVYVLHVPVILFRARAINANQAVLNYAY